MTAARSVPYVVFISAGKPETGLWCDACQLPSRVRVPVTMVTETGADDTTIPPIDACTECRKGFTT